MVWEMRMNNIMLIGLEGGLRICIQQLYVLFNFWSNVLLGGKRFECVEVGR